MITERCYLAENLYLIMLLPTIRLVYNRKKTATRTKSAPIEICVTHKGKRTYLTTGIAAKLDQWNGQRIIRCVGCESMTKMVYDLFEKVEKVSAELCAANDFSFDELRRELERENDRRVDMFDWIRERIEQRVIKPNTRQQHITAFNFFRSCGLFHSWKDLTLANIIMFDEAIKRKVKCSTSVYGYHKRIKPYIREAVKFGLIKENPYDQFSTPHGKSTRRKYLTEEELNAVENLSGLSDSLTAVHDCFLFSCYTGLAYADASSLTADDFTQQRGKVYIISKRQKTDSDITVRLTDKALAIAERYNYRLPFVSNQKYNLMLKVIGERAGVPHLTSHMARHTFATIALHRGVPIAVVSKMLGHSDIKITQIYAKVLLDDIDKGFDIMEGKMRK